MKTLQIIIKSLKEQLRSFWILLLTLSLGPFFIFVYFLITETSKPQYKILLVNNDKSILADGKQINHGILLTNYLTIARLDTAATAFNVEITANQNTGIEKLKNKQADALIVINTSFSESVNKLIIHDSTPAPKVEFIGDLTNTNYLISAVWANEVINQYILQTTNSKRIIDVKETALGISANIGYFDAIVPGILIVSLIMLMFTASIAFVSEVENKTIMRLKLSKMSAIEFLGGISIVQVLVGLVSIMLTLLVAISLGFNYAGSLLIMILVGGLTSLSIISFSLIIASLTKSSNEVLVLGNFPMFLFMFFTGAAFPLKSDPFITIAGYPITIQGLMSPTHAISALNKTLILNMDITSIIPEMIAILFLTILYFIIGALIFKHRHLRLK
jgi:ABC-2 type transport system permease protein